MARKDPTQCRTMQELRAEIDAIDTALIDLLVARMHCIDQAVKLKRIENVPARAPDRIEQVVTNVTEMAAARGLDPALVEEMWRTMIEWAIAREAAQLEN